MIPVSNDYKRQLIKGNRNYLIKADVFLADNLTSTPDFTLTNEEIWDNGITIDQSISSDSSFDIGAAIVGSLSIVINNINNNYSQYDFYNANITLYLGVTGDIDEYDVQRYYRIGFYVVDEPQYNGSLITLNCLDNMTWFDVPFENITTTSTTAGQLVQDICTKVGVLLGTPTFPNYTTAINVTLEQKLNCREVLQYVAQICCCYCKIDRAGELALAWYDKSAIIGITDYDGGTFSTTTTPYSDGDDVQGGRWYYDEHGNYIWENLGQKDGGTFSDLLNGAWLTQNFEISVSTDDIVVTGCRVRNTSKKDNAYDELWVDSTLEQTHDRYVLVIDNNPLITTQAQAQTIANTVGDILAGLPIRGYTATSLADFSYETGDMVTVIDFRGHRYYTWITHFSFTTNNSETFSCGVESIRKRAEERFSSAVKTLAEANENASVALSDYDSAVKAMNELAQSAIGYYKYEYNIGGATVTWLHDGATEDTTDPENPLFPNSDVVFKISGDGVFLSHDGGVTYDQGYDANSGTAILALLYAEGIRAEWLKVNSLSAITANMGTLTAGSITGGTITGTTEIIAQSAKVTVTGDGYVSHREKPSSSYSWRFDLGSRFCNCMYDDGSWHWVNGGATEIYKYLQGAYSPSDRRAKTKIEDLNPDFSKNLIMQTQPKMFEFTYNEGIKQFGMIAQEVQETLEDLKFKNRNALVDVPEDPEQWLSIEYKQFVPHLINVVKMQQEQIDELKQELADLKARTK